MKTTMKNNILISFLILNFVFVLSNARQEVFAPNFSSMNEIEDSMKENDIYNNVDDHDERYVNKRKLDEKISVEILPQERMKEKDRITKLPGLPGTCSFIQKFFYFFKGNCVDSPKVINFEQYGGYVTVNKEAGRALFYYFVEADGVFIKDYAPLILWLNGGPGCSSFGYGAMSEIGPFRVKSDGETLYENIYSWNKVANLLFLESPVGVGYSYSNTTSDLKTNSDQRATDDSYAFLLNWLERFPEYKNRDLYIIGENYAGHYIPQLANRIIEENKLPNNKNTIINLKGIALGNPNLDDIAENTGKYEYLWNHGLISNKDMDVFTKKCNVSAPLVDGSPECLDVISKVNDYLSGIDLNNVNAPVCSSEDGKLSYKPKKTSLIDFDPCTDNYVNNYLNLREVQIAIHANVTKLEYPWKGCRDELNYVNRSVIGPSMLPLIKDLMMEKIRVLIYCGDLDGVIPCTSTLYALHKLNLTEHTPLTPWKVEDEAAGYSTVYKGGLRFTTIKEAGHKVPSYKPVRALVMIKSFLKHEMFPHFEFLSPKFFPTSQANLPQPFVEDYALPKYDEGEYK